MEPAVLDSLPTSATPTGNRADRRHYPAGDRRAHQRDRRKSRLVDPSPGDLILPRRLGRYTLFAHIGQGGMANIFLAQAEAGLAGSRLVVIKEILPRLSREAAFIDMLVSEAKLAARLGHANVAKVEDLGRVDGSIFIAMEYVEGIDAREMLRRCARSSIPLPVEFSLRIVTEVLRGLDYAHRARGDDGDRLGIVHRDVSPSNILLSFEGEVKLCDFGIARANAFADAASEQVIVGKAGYMSPEQARGEALDVRADVFAVGIILWEALAGRRLYRVGEGERLIDAARAAQIPDLPPRGLDRESELFAIVRRALATDREDRHPSAAAMLSDLDEYVAGARMLASPIRFGDWLMENFGKEVVRDRRARERVMRALALGPPAVIRPIGPVPSPDADMTPSAFPVALRAGNLPEEPIVDEACEMPPAAISLTPPELSPRPNKPPPWPETRLAVSPSDPAPHVGLKLFALVIALAAMAWLALRILA